MSTRNARAIAIVFMVPALFAVSACGTAASSRIDAPSTEATPDAAGSGVLKEIIAAPSSDPSSDITAIDAQFRAIDNELGQAVSGMSSSEGDPGQ
jgi:hypothetical protein